MIADRTTYSIVYEIWEPPEDKGGKLNSYSQLNFPEKYGKIKSENNYDKKNCIFLQQFLKKLQDHICFLKNTSWPLGQSMKTFKFQLALCHHVK